MTATRLFRAAAACGLAVFAASHASPTRADKIKNPTAIFAGLDKITGRIISFEAAVDETVQFGALQLTPRLCYTRPPTEPANTTAFIEVDEVTFTNEYRRIFGGWIFASSPGLHGIEHPIYDVWLTGCKGGTQIIVDAPDPSKIDPLKPTTDPRAGTPAARRQQPPGPGQQAQPGLVAPPLGADGLPPVADRPRGQIGVTAPQGVPVAPRQPTQRFFPTNPAGSGVGRDPAGNNN
jgi:hypothetical protein